MINIPTKVGNQNTATTLQIVQFRKNLGGYKIMKHTVRNELRQKFAVNIATEGRFQKLPNTPQTEGF